MKDDAARLRRIFLAMTALRWLGPGLSVPVLVLVLTESGLGLADVGVVFAVYGASTAVLELPTGGLADAIGRRPVLVTAAMLFVAFDLGLMFGRGLGVLVAVAVVGGLGRALSSGPLEAWYIDRARRVDPDLRLRPDLSRAGVAEGVALTIGALASAGITTLAADTQVAGFDIVMLPIVAAAVSDLVLAVAVSILVREHDRATTPGAAMSAFRDVPTVVRSGTRLAWSTTMLRRLLATSAAVALGAVTIEVLWQPRLAELTGGTASAAKLAGLIVAGFMLAATGGAALAAHLPTALARRPGPGASALLVAAAVSALGLAAAGSPLALAVALFGFYLFLASSSVLRMELLHEWVESSRRATIVSVNSLAQQLGNVAASLVVVRIAGITTISIGWIIGATFVALGAAFVATTRMPTRTSSSNRGRPSTRSEATGKRSMR